MHPRSYYFIDHVLTILIDSQTKNKSNTSWNFTVKIDKLSALETHV